MSLAPNGGLCLGSGAPPAHRGFWARRVAGLLVGYKRWISPLLPRSCRFTPTCSEYARVAVLERGVVRGGGSALWRLLRCHPWSSGGLDLPTRAVVSKGR